MMSLGVEASQGWGERMATLNGDAVNRDDSFFHNDIDPAFCLLGYSYMRE